MDRLHSINVGPGGTFRPFGEYVTAPSDVDKIIAQIEKNPNPRVGIYVHGGLVDEDNGMAGAARFKEVFASADTHGVGIVWETGWWETIKKNLSDIFSTKLFQKLVEKVMKKVVGYFTGVGARGKGGGNADAEIKELLQDPTAEFDFAREARQCAEGLTAKEMEDWRDDLSEGLESELDADDEFQELYVDLDERTEFFDDPQVSIDQAAARSADEGPQEKGLVSWFTVAKKVASVAYRVGKRFWNGRDHGLHATLVEEVFREFYVADLIKTLEWDNMKKAAADMWTPNDGLEGEMQHAGTYLIEKLIELKQRKPELTIDVVGHSAGAIVLCEMFASIRKRYRDKIGIRNLILLAPAATSSLFYAHMLKNQALFGDFYMFTMPDELEKTDPVMKPAHQILSIVYPSSLLYIVSGILEEEVDAPLVGMLRFATGKSPFDTQKLQKIEEYINSDDKTRLIKSKEGTEPDPNNLVSGSISHGGFSNDPATLESIALIIRRSNQRQSS